MDSRLYQAGLIAIPLKTERAMPNYLVIEQQYGCSQAEQLNIQTGEKEIMDCVSANYKLVLREILAPNEKYPNEDFREAILFPIERIDLPIDLLPMFVTHQRIKNNIQIVNLVLSNFSFRGTLENFILEVDETVLDNILTPITTTTENITTTLELITTTQEVTTTENITTSLQLTTIQPI